MNSLLANPQQILVVDDHPVNQMVLTTMLAELNFGAETANSGIEAIQMIAEQNFDMVFMDLQMPVMDGYETARQIRKHPNHRQTPIIAITASTIDGQITRQCQGLMDELLGKPFESVDLEKLLTRWLVKVTAIEPLDCFNPSNNGAQAEPNLLNLSNLTALDRDSIDRLQATFSGAEQSSLLELLEVFLDTFEMLYQQLGKNLLSGDLGAIRQTAHALKSSSGNVGALRFMSISSDIEQLTQLEQTDPIGAMAKPWSQIQQEYRLLLPDLADLIAQLKK